MTGFMEGLDANVQTLEAPTSAGLGSAIENGLDISRADYHAAYGGDSLPDRGEHLSFQASMVRMAVALAAGTVMVEGLARWMGVR